MSIELMLAASGAIGVGAGYAYASVRALEERCEVLSMARTDVLGAIDDLDALLSAPDMPNEVKSLAVLLLSAFADGKIGKSLIDRVALDKPSDPASIEGNPIEIALNEWGRKNPKLEQRARKALAVMTLGLAIIHLGDRVKLMKVEQRAVRDPLWTSLGLVGPNLSHAQVQ